MPFDPGSAKLISDTKTFDPSTATPVEEPSIFTKALDLFAQSQVQQASADKKLGDQALAVAQQPGAGLYSMATSGIAGTLALANASAIDITGNSAPGDSFSDIFSKEYNTLHEPLAEAYKAPTPEGLAMSEGLGKVLGTITEGFGDILYHAGEKSYKTPTGETKYLIPPNPIAGAFGQALATLGMLAAPIPGLKGKSGVAEPKIIPKLSGDPITDFAIKYPETTRHIEASHVGDAPVAAAKTAEPTKHFARIVEDAVDKEIGLSKYNDILQPLLDSNNKSTITLGDKIKMIVQKHAAISGENIPIADQVEYANSLIKKVFELQQHADAIEMAAKPLALPAPKVPYVIDEPIIVDPNGVAQLQAKLASPSLDLIAQWAGTTVDKTGISGRSQLKQLQNDTASMLSGPKYTRSKERGMLDISSLDKNVEDLKHLGDGVTKYAAAGLVQPPRTLRYNNPGQFDAITMYRATKPGTDPAIQPGSYVTNDKSYMVSKAQQGMQIHGHQIKISDLVEVHPGSYIYAPAGTDLGPMIHYRDSNGNAITFKDLLPVEPINHPGLRGQQGAIDNKTIQEKATINMPTEKLMSIRDKDRSDWAQPKMKGRLEAIQKSIKDYGIKQPVTVLISKADNLAYLPNGNHRVLASSNLGLPTVPVRLEMQDIPFTEMQRSFARPLEELGINTNMVPKKVRTPSQQADFEEIKRILGSKQRGVFDIDGIEKNTEATKKAIENAVGKGWTLNNPDAAAQYVKEVMQKPKIDIEQSLKDFGVKALKKARRAFYAHDYDIRKDLKNAGPAGEIAHDRMVVQNGATMAAKVKMDEFNKNVFDKFNHDDRNAIDEVTRLRRIIQIDKYKGVNVVRHEGGITGPMADARLTKIKEGLGSEAFAKINDASTKIFDAQKVLLDDLRNNGLIDDKLHQKLYNLDYTRTEYLDKIDPIIPIASHIRNMPTSIKSSGIAELGHGKNVNVNMDTQGLLMEDIARVENRIFRNNTLLAVRDLAVKNPDNGIVKLPGPQAIKTLESGDQIMRHTPEGFTSIGVRVKGKQQFILMKDDYAEQFVTRPEAMPEWLAVTFRTVSGTSLLKSTSTGMNPGFLIAGIPMDIFHTWIAGSNVYSSHLPVYLAQMGKDLTATAKDAFTKTGVWEDAMSEGIGSSYLTHESRNLTDPSKSISGQIRPAFSKTREVLSYLNDVSDMWIRLAYRNRLINSGMESWKATAMTRDRLDYFQGGMITKAFDTFIPYANVTVQAAGKAIEAGLNDPQALAIKSAWILGTAASVKLAQMVTSPQTDKNMSVMDKVRNFNITFGDQFYTIDANGNKRYMYIPIRLDQVVMPLNAAVVGGLEMSEYGKAPNGIAGNAIGQVSPISSAFPIPTMDAIAAYVSNYDQFTDSSIYKGPKVLPQDEVRTFGTGKPTGAGFVAAGQATGMSPMRLEAAAGKLINTNNFYIQAAGGAYKLLFEGANPRDQASTTMMMLQQVPGLRNIVKFTTPATSMLDDLQKAEQEAGSVTAQHTKVLNDLIFQQEHEQNGITLKTIQTYINNQPQEERQKLADHAKYTLNVNKVMQHYKASDNIPARSWWIASAKAPADVRAQAFYDQWVSATSEDRQRMLSIANSLQSAGVGYLSPEFQKAFAAERKLLGDEHR